MAPETGAGVPSDGRTDIYGLGCVAYWLLTGQLVFEASSPVEAMVKHARDTLTPPSQISELGIPEALDELVLECLQKEPDNRPQAAGEVIDERRFAVGDFRVVLDVLSAHVPIDRLGGL